MTPLEDYYSGDDWWHEFARVFRGELDRCSFKSELTSMLLGDAELAEVIYASVGDRALKYMVTPIPALSGLTPQECMETPEKVRRLREVYGEDVRLAAAYGDTSGDREMLRLADEKGYRVFKGRP